MVEIGIGLAQPGIDDGAGGRGVPGRGDRADGQGHEGVVDLGGQVIGQGDPGRRRGVDIVPLPDAAAGGADVDGIAGRIGRIGIGRDGRDAAADGPIGRLGASRKSPVIGAGPMAVQFGDASAIRSSMSSTVRRKRRVVGGRVSDDSKRDLKR